MKVLTIRYQGRTVAKQLLTSPLLLIGGSPLCDIILREPGIRPIHFTLEWLGTGKFVSETASQDEWALTDTDGSTDIYDRNAKVDLVAQGTILGQNPLKFNEFVFSWQEDGLARADLDKRLLTQAIHPSAPIVNTTEIQNGILEVIKVHRNRTSSAITQIEHLDLQAAMGSGRRTVGATSSGLGSVQGMRQTREQIQGQGQVRGQNQGQSQDQMQHQSLDQSPDPLSSQSSGQSTDKSAEGILNQSIYKNVNQNLNQSSVQNRFTTHGKDRKTPNTSFRMAIGGGLGFGGGPGTGPSAAMVLNPMGGEMSEACLRDIFAIEGRQQGQRAGIAIPADSEAVLYQVGQTVRRLKAPHWELGSQELLKIRRKDEDYFFRLVNRVEAPKAKPMLFTDPFYLWTTLLCLVVFVTITYGSYKYDRALEEENKLAPVPRIARIQIVEPVAPPPPAPPEPPQLLAVTEPALTPPQAAAMQSASMKPAPIVAMPATPSTKQVEIENQKKKVDEKKTDGKKEEKSSHQDKKEIKQAQNKPAPKTPDMLSAIRAVNNGNIGGSAGVGGSARAAGRSRSSSNIGSSSGTITSTQNSATLPGTGPTHTVASLTSIRSAQANHTNLSLEGSTLGRTPGMPLALGPAMNSEKQSPNDISPNGTTGPSGIKTEAARQAPEALALKGAESHIQLRDHVPNPGTATQPTTAPTSLGKGTYGGNPVGTGIYGVSNGSTSVNGGTATNGTTANGGTSGNGNTSANTNTANGGAGGGGAGAGTIDFDSGFGDKDAIPMGLNRAAVRNAVNGAHKEVRTCYEQNLSINSKLHGRIVFRWEIQPSGRVKWIEVLANSTESDRLAKCVSQAISAIGFPKSLSGMATLVKYPFEFSNAGKKH